MFLHLKGYAMLVSLQIKLVLKITILLSAVYFGLTVYTVLMAPKELTELLYSESSAYEVFSYWLWGGLALLTLASSMSMRLRVSAATAALLMGARELDMHKSLFSMSFIKTRFYTSAEITLNEKIIGVTLIILLLVLAAYLFSKLLQRMRQQGLDLSMLLLLIGLSMGVVGKILDRFSSQMRELLNIVVTDEARLMVMALEESAEMIMPVILMIAVLTYNNAQKQHKGYGS